MFQKSNPRTCTLNDFDISSNMIKDLQIYSLLDK